MIDLCVVNYNTPRQLNRLLNTLGREKTDSWSVYLADNKCDDTSFEVMLSVANSFPVAKAVGNENIGYAAACNQLASFGDGDIIGLLNSDVWLSTSDVISIQKTFDEHPEIAILGPKQRDERGLITFAGIGGTNTAPRHRGWHEPDPEDIKYRDLCPMVTVSGSAYFIRRSVWDDLTNDPDYRSVVSTLVANKWVEQERTEPLGAFLPTRHYYEETFCSYFARHKGYNVFYDGRISIGHSWHASHERGSEADQLWSESQFLFRFACDTLGIDHD